MQNLFNFKKVGFLVPLFLCFISKAQEKINLGFNFTPRAGVAFSYSGNDAQDRKTFKISPDAGIEFKLDISQHFAVTTGVFYTQKAKYYSYEKTQSFFTDLSNSFFGASGLDTVITGLIGSTASYINDTIYSHYHGKVNIQYIQIPLMATLDIKNVSISAGGYMGIKLTATSTEVLTQDFPMYRALQPAFSDPSVAPFINLLLTPYAGLKGPVTNTLTPDFIATKDYGLVFEVAGRFNEHFKMSSTVYYGLSNYSTNAVKYPGKHFTINFNLGVTFGKLKGVKVPTKFF